MEEHKKRGRRLGHLFPGGYKKKLPSKKEALEEIRKEEQEISQEVETETAQEGMPEKEFEEELDETELAKP